MELFGMNSDRNYSVFLENTIEVNLGNNWTIPIGFYSKKFYNTCSGSVADLFRQAFDQAAITHIIYSSDS